MLRNLCQYAHDSKCSGWPGHELSDIIPTFDYIPAMQIPPRPLALFACLCLLAVQMSGVHLHIETHNDSANLHGTHLHQAENHGHDHHHNADIDVSLLEKLSMNWTQLIPLILAD